MTRKVEPIDPIKSTTPKDIFTLTKKQQLEIKKIKDWGELSELKNPTIGNKIDIYT